MELKELSVRYVYDGADLPCPSNLIGNPSALRAFHAALHPAITTADVTTRQVGDTMVHEYTRTVGTKG